MSQLRQQIPEGGIIPGNNQTGADIPAGTPVMEDTTNVDGIALPTDHTSVIIGVTLEVIKAGSRGDVQREGLAIVNTGNATVAKGDQLEALAAGTAQTLTGGGKQFGIANTASQGAPTGQCEMYLRTPSS